MKSVLLYTYHRIYDKKTKVFYKQRPKEEIRNILARKERISNIELWRRRRTNQETVPLFINGFGQENLEDQ